MWGKYEWYDEDLMMMMTTTKVTMLGGPVMIN